MMFNPQLDMERVGFPPWRRSMFSRSEFSFFLPHTKTRYPGYSMSGFGAMSRAALAILSRVDSGGTIPRARSHSSPFPMHYDNAELGRRSVNGGRP